MFVQRALYVDEELPDLAVVCLANPTAGILSGDHLALNLSLDPEARARVGTASATKIYAMTSGSAAQETRIRVGEAAYLEYLPDPIIPFRGARFTQHTIITLAPGATLIYGDVLAPGRLSMGESLAYDRLRSQLTVETSCGRLRYHEAIDLDPARRSPRALGVLGNEHLATTGTFMVFTGQIAVDDLLALLRAAVDDESTCRGRAAIAPGGHGVILKILAADTSGAQSVIHRAWAAARRAILGVPLPSARKY